VRGAGLRVCADGDAWEEVGVFEGRMTDERLAEFKRTETSPHVWEIVEALESEREKVARVVALHRPWRIYGVFGHEHTEGYE
jgi:hypothetical protein